MPMRCAVRAMRQAISPRLAISSVRNMRPSHAEHAEARWFDRGVQGGGQRKPQYAPRVDRIDDAVVPKSRGGVVGIALPFVLCADRGLERLVLLGASCGSTAHLGQH